MQIYPGNQYGERTVASLQAIIDNPVELLRHSKASPPAGDPAQLNILSASSYPQAMSQPDISNSRGKKRKATTTTEFSRRSFFKDADESVTHARSPSSTDQGLPRPRKKSKRNSVDDEDIVDAITNDDQDKKQRGRPRLDTMDETPADRRRTQIRLAQRAYRNRKENTISALKQRVARLQSTVEQMNQTFMAMNDNLLEAGVLSNHANLAIQLKTVAEQFMLLSKQEHDSDWDEEQQQRDNNHLTKCGPVPPHSQIVESKSDSIDDKESARTFDTTVYSRNTGNLTQNVPTSNGGIEDLPVVSDTANYQFQETETQPWSNNNYMMQLNAQIPDTQVPGQVFTVGQNDSALMPIDVLNNSGFAQQLDSQPILNIERPSRSPPRGHYTYSFHESTFARRLHRMSLERAYRCLVNPNINPAYAGRVFRFSMCLTNRKQMALKFKEILLRNAGDSLENWDIPYVHIGGAGTHFPQRDTKTGALIYPPNLVDPSTFFGPQPWLSPETPRQENSVEDMLEAIGFGGKWFDAHDVEEYLKTKGIFLDGTSSFIELDPSLVKMPRLLQQSSVSSIQTIGSDGSTPEPPRTPSPPLTNNEITIASNDFGAGFVLSNHDQQLMNFQNQSKPVTDQQMFNPDSYSWPAWNNIQMTAAGGATTNSQIYPNNIYPYASQRRHQTPITFNVETFMQRMLEGTICLGRAPGFRKETIDKALSLALQEAF